MPEVVSNTGPLIALAGIERFELLHRLFGNLLIPAAVRIEILDEATLAAVVSADWLRVQIVNDAIAVQLLRGELDAGESEAIVLAREINADLLLVDERSARNKAYRLGLPTIGTLGILLMAKDKGLLTTIKPLLDELRRADFHMSDELYHWVLESAGEAQDS